MTLEMEEQVRTRAYFIWEEQGCPAGRDVEHWLVAEGELTAREQAEEQPAALTKAAPKAKPKTAKPSKTKLVAVTASAQKPAAVKTARRASPRAITLN